MFSEAAYLYDPGNPESVRELQQPKKVNRIGYLSGSTEQVSPPVPMEFGWRCASWAT